MIRKTLTHENVSILKKPNENYSTAYPRHTFFPQGNSSPLIPQLPILEELADTVKKNGFPDLEDIVIVGVQHILPTTAAMFDVIIKAFNVNPTDIFLTGKFYSSCQPIENYMRNRGIHLMRNKIPRRPGQFEYLIHDTVCDMWEKVAKHLKENKKKTVIMFDEGAHCLENIPTEIRYEYALASLEQTRFGLYTDVAGTQLFPLIDVARSAAKKKLESPLISKAILKRIKEILSKISINEHTVFGVVGNGVIGSAITEHLLSDGYKVVIYDENEDAFHNINHRNCFRVDSISQVIVGSNIIFGCTGKDISKGINILGLAKKELVLISTSSQDIEFKELLKSFDEIRFTRSDDGTLSYLNFSSASGANITVLENGFPVNFDRTAASDPAEDMELTRGLLLGAFIQAVTIAKQPVDNGSTINRSTQVMLDPFIQQFVAKKWLKKQKEMSKNLDCFEDIEWIKGNSQGKYEENFLIRQSLKKNTSPHIRQIRSSL